MLSASITTSPVVRGVAPVSVSVTNSNKELASATVSHPVLKPAIHTVTTTTPSTHSNLSALKSGIMMVFTSYSESSFASIKSNERTTPNTWNYKYTYNTKVSIPGEKFNMVYSFPFAYSQLDFVSVLEETDKYDKNFEAIYKSYQKQLTETLKASEGWTGKCLPNTEKSPISDVEFTHPTLGSVVLDYCKTPKGKHILYLRFLPYS